ncbi:hypothetical protein EOL94_03020 [bacterium]|nr:hypothetical protein [bacterium]
MKKKSLIYIVIALVVVIIGVLIFLNKDKININVKDLNQNINQEINNNQEGQDLEDDKAEKEEERRKETERIEKDNNVYNEAIENGDVEKCLEMENSDGAIFCIQKIAREKKDISLCDKLSGNDKDKCQGKIIRDLSIEDDDIVKCLDIVLDNDRNGCINIILENNGYEIDLCKNLEGEDKNYCIDTVQYIKAIEANDCSGIVNSAIKAECESALSFFSEEDNNKSVDSDGDGLIDIDEVNVYGTDPLNPDSDGDGYNDGQEVRNGYDPLK